MKRIESVACWLIVVLLASCGNKDQAAAPPAGAAKASVASSPSADAASSTAAPDFGGITKVSREAVGIGSTPQTAILSALQSAVAQVNGVRVASELQTVRAGLDLAVDGQHAHSIRADAFAQKVVAASRGAITGYEILSQQEIDKVDEEISARVRAADAGYQYQRTATGDGANVDVNRGARSLEVDVSHKIIRSYWQVRVRADIAQYRAPDDKGRPKIVVAMPRTKGSSYVLADSRVRSDDVARAVRGQLSDILTQTRRFVVLDREFSDELQAEIDAINSGNVRVQDSARLGQQLATDLILIPSIERFEYLRSSRQLRMSDRELVSYSGGGRITLRLVNATTGEVVMSESFDHKLASADPSTMPRVIDGASMTTQMMASFADQIGGAIVNEIFPVSVIARDGDQVVLSQGGDSLRVGQRWQAVLLGDELKDPQTGRSLGRKETPIAAIRIDRVAAQMSYGTFEGAVDLGSQGFSPGSIALRQRLPAVATASAPIKPDAARSAASDAQAPAKPVGRAAPASGSHDISAAAAPAAQRPAGQDDKW